MNQCPVTEKENINSRSNVYLVLSFISFFLKLSTQRVDNPMFYFQQKKREKREIVLMIESRNKKRQPLLGGGTVASIETVLFLTKSKGKVSFLKTRNVIQYIC